MSARCCYRPAGHHPCSSTAAYAIVLVVGNVDHTLTEWQAGTQPGEDGRQLLAVCAEHMKIDPRLVQARLQELVGIFRKKTKSEPDEGLCGIVLKPIDCDEARAALLAILAKAPELAGVAPPPVEVEIVRESDLPPDDLAVLKRSSKVH